MTRVDWRLAIRARIAEWTRAQKRIRLIQTRTINAHGVVETRLTHAWIDQLVAKHAGKTFLCLVYKKIFKL